MTLLLDTEGVSLPKCDTSGTDLFDASLCDWGNGKGPSLAINIPMYFETETDAYGGAGVLAAPIQEILEDYLSEIVTTDGAEHAASFVSWLRGYADRLEQVAIQQATIAP